MQLFGVRSLGREIGKLGSGSKDAQQEERSYMRYHQLIAWIRDEIASTKVVLSEEVVGYEETLEPNPEMYWSESTDLPTTRDRQHVIIKTPIVEVVERTVPDRERRSHAAEALAAFVLSDERYLYLAEELMRRDPLYLPHWERLLLHGRGIRTRKAALRHLGRAPWQIFIRAVGAVAAVFGSLCAVCALICFYAAIVYCIWPDSKVGVWMASVVKRILAEATRMIYD